VKESYKRKPNTKCCVCNKEVYRRPGVIKSNKSGVYCSSACYGKSCRNEHPCLVCKEPILAGAHKKTCNRSCANRYRAGIRYKIGRPKDKVKTQLALKKRLFVKRGRVCEVCGHTNVKILQLHHIDRNRTNNNFKNLQILCPNCHAEEHLGKK